jgi:hypothetical protein
MNSTNGEQLERGFRGNVLRQWRNHPLIGRRNYAEDPLPQPFGEVSDEDLDLLYGSIVFPFMRAVGLELAPHNVQFNAIAWIRALGRFTRSHTDG